jgi:hypothetical protein
MRAYSIIGLFIESSSSASEPEMALEEVLVPENASDMLDKRDKSQGVGR